MRDRRSTETAFSRPHLAAAVLALGTTVLLALYLELLGWRILQPDLSLEQAWSGRFLLGALRTASGALLAGLLPLGIGLLVPRWRAGARSRFVLLWTSGATVFLLAMAGLLAWAP